MMYLSNAKLIAYFKTDQAYTRLVKMSAVFVALLSLQPTAMADEGSPNWFDEHVTLYGFGSLGASYHSEEGLGYRRNIEQKDAVEAHKLDFASDSILGGQVDVRFNDKLATSLQMVSRNNAYGNWKPTVVSAFLKYSPTPSLSIRLGQMTQDSNFGSASRFASYAYTHIRPSPEVYGLFSTYDRYQGIDIDYRFPLATGIGRLHVVHGEVVGDRYLLGASMDGRSNKIVDTKVTGAMFAWQKDTLEVRAFVELLKLTDVDIFDPLAQQLASVPLPQARATVAQIKDAHTIDVSIYGLAAEYELRAWKLSGIVSHYTNNGFPKLYGNVAKGMLEYNIGDFTPYAMYAYSKTTREDDAMVLPPLPQLRPLQAAYEEAVTILAVDQTTLSLGLRYEINDHAAFKIQVDKTRADLSPTIISTDSSRRDKDMTLISASIDFLF